jgi:hypothetical protein
MAWPANRIHRDSQALTVQSRPTALRPDQQIGERTTTRTRSSGEQRGIKGKAAEPDEDTARSFAQVSTRVGRK